MTIEKHDNLQEKYKSSVTQILKICKVFSNFYFNLTIKKKTHWVVQSFGNKVIERFALTRQTKHPN